MLSRSAGCAASFACARTDVNVARRGSSGAQLVISRRATLCASAPLRRTTPIPPRPGGVAMATMVSEVENTVAASTQQPAAGNQQPDRQTGCRLLAAGCYLRNEM